MTRHLALCGAIGAAVLLAGCNRGPDPMTLVQSPEEFNCLAVVADRAGTSNVTLLALRRTQAGSVAQVSAGRDGQVWTCRTTPEGFVTEAAPGLRS
jgi:hypothetical protein